MTTMLQKMAIALYLADYPGTPGHPDESDTDAMMFEKYRDHYLNCVRAVLLAAREPDYEVVMAGHSAGLGNIREAWQEMVGAILNQKPDA